MKIFHKIILNIFLHTQYMHTKLIQYQNFYSKKIEYSYLFVFKIDNNDQIINSETINLLTEKNHKYRKVQTNT